MCLPYRLVLLAGAPSNEFMASLDKKKNNTKTNIYEMDTLTTFKGLHLSWKMDLQVSRGLQTNGNDPGTRMDVARTSQESADFHTPTVSPGGFCVDL